MEITCVESPEPTEFGMSRIKTNVPQTPGTKESLVKVAIKGTGGSRSHRALQAMLRNLAFIIIF